MMTINRTISLVEQKCWECGCDFAIEQSVLATKKQYGKTMFCPNGCRLGFRETPEQKIKREMQSELARVKRDKEYMEATAKRQRQRAESAERSLSATRGVVTRIKNRVGKGVCPCCNRSFADLHRHMETKHPEYATSDS